jgi:hypothetical protein
MEVRCFCEMLFTFVVYIRLDNIVIQNCNLSILFLKFNSLGGGGIECRLKNS